jgi:hypothetical protein
VRWPLSDAVGDRLPQRFRLGGFGNPLPLEPIGFRHPAVSGVDDERDMPCGQNGGYIAAISVSDTNIQDRDIRGIIRQPAFSGAEAGQTNDLFTTDALQRFLNVQCDQSFVFQDENGGRSLHDILQGKEAK